MNRLKSLGFVQESVVSSGAINSAGFEIARHDFSLTEEGARVALHKSQKNEKPWQKIKAAVDRFKQAGEIDYMEMSVAAKTVYMLAKEDKPATVLELSESAKSRTEQDSAGLPPNA